MNLPGVLGSAWDVVWVGFDMSFKICSLFNYMLYKLVTITM